MWSRHPKTKGRPPRILDYDDVIGAKHISDLFGRHKALILFYPGKEDGEGNVDGHYTCMIRHPDGLDYYDPYGDVPDNPKKYSVKRDMLYAEKGRRNSLIALMKKLHGEGQFVDYSHHKHQNPTMGIATCGRHCLNRCMFPELGNDEYNALLSRMAKRWRLTLDDTVCAIW
ncbi:hypothetical protein FNF27_04201 [Cafeteria roenbergensis]|uniref:Uncharacterized protein n=1 Tax=Cafeteria roenbergensis TaxID=33653 RepID=A0A5A8EAX1_CAFRO|nr:hypothetical protein FNF27_04201 [Cafeteria roenbergensis]